MIIYSHRGIDLERREALHENSLASFEWAAAHDFGIELDLQLSADGELIVVHDATLERLSNGSDKRPWRGLSAAELRLVEARFGPICRLSEVFRLLECHPLMHAAIHIKGSNQDAEFMQRLLVALREVSHLHRRLLLFDLKPAAGGELRREFAALPIAASVADAYDVARFQALTLGTLLSVEEVVALKSTYNWMWLDEWDRKDKGASTKNLYAADALSRLRADGFGLALISPELHNADGHEDGHDIQTLERRWAELFSAKPDAICTDYPARLRRLSATA